MKRFKHDCDACRFIGHSLTIDGKQLDVYECPSDGGPGDPTWLARFGNEPHEYVSSPAQCLMRRWFNKDDWIQPMTPEWVLLACRKGKLPVK